MLECALVLRLLSLRQLFRQVPFCPLGVVAAVLVAGDILASARELTESVARSLVRRANPSNRSAEQTPK